MIPGSANSLLLGSAAGGYTISRSLRFNSADSAYLSRTPASAGNRKTWTFSCWVKRASLGSGFNTLLECSPSTNKTRIALYTDKLYVDNTYVTSFTWQTDALLRDCSAWYHIVVVLDTSAAVSTDRLKAYVNGVAVAGSSGSSYPALNQTPLIADVYAHGISGASGYLDGYLADIHFIDGQALDPTSFGEFSATTGVWMPKRYAGTYGTNGFKLDFSDNSAATATTLGKDSSGNGNNFTPNNLSVTAGAGNDSLVDVPVNGTQPDTGAGGEVRGNYATLNTLNKGSNVTLLNGNLDYSYSAAGGVVTSTFPIPAGKWYWELSNVATYAIVGCYQSGGLGLSYLGSSGVSFGFTNGGFAASSGVTAPTGSISSFSGGDVIGFAFDKDAGTLNVYKNNTLALSYTGLSGEWYPAVGQNAAGSGSFNFGQRPFAYTAPSGFKALCTANLPAPTIVKPSTVMDVVTYAGTSANQTVSGLGFEPDLVWIKNRSNALNFNHVLQDSVRGFTTGRKLSSNLTNSESSSGSISDDFGYVSGSTANGFTLSKNGTGSYDYFQTNATSNTYVAWTWDAGSSTVTNTAGTISSQVRANASAGFSVVTWTAQASAGTVGHGLGVAPEFVAMKDRDGAFSWYVYHKSVGTQKFLVLNNTNASTSNSGYFTTTPTATYFDPGTTFTTGFGFAKQVAYCFAPVAGYSAFGSYTGNGNADGPFVYLGFRPALVIVKMSSSTGNWTMLDYQREGYNVDNDPLYPNLSNAEGTTDLIDITSNGFKVRTTDATFNTNAGTYVYAAWAQSPFSLARAR